MLQSHIKTTCVISISLLLLQFPHLEFFRKFRSCDRQLQEQLNCKSFAVMINRGRAPPGALSPSPIACEGLFSLDVDDDIWQDVGLEDDHYNSNPPRWLSDDDVHNGIRAQLELDRCLEEEERVKAERCAIQEWFMEEWACVQHAKRTTGECHSIRQSQCLADFSVAVDVVAYQLEIKSRYLLCLCVTWQSKITAIPHSKMLPSCWGPTEAQLHDAAVYKVTADWDVGDQAGEPSNHCAIDEELGPQVTNQVTILIVNCWRLLKRRTLPTLTVMKLTHHITWIIFIWIPQAYTTHLLLVSDSECHCLKCFSSKGPSSHHLMNLYSMLSFHPP